MDKPRATGKDLLVHVKAVSVNPVDTKVRKRGPKDIQEPEITPSVPVGTAPDDSALGTGPDRTLIVVIIAGCAVLAGLLLYLTWWRNRSKSGAPES